MSVIPEETYQFKNLVLSDKYLDEPSKLAAVIGVNDDGEPILFDFAKQPHLFIGGDQGCGKSTLIHSIIMSLMQRNTPDEFQFVYFDPKGLDVNLYKQSKYLYFNNKNISASFNFLLQECNNRGRILSKNKKKTVAAYNEFAALCDDVVPISELFVIVDEVSYLLEENKIRQHIEELINYGRAVGIHLIIADTNPTLGNVLKIAKLIPNKVVFRFTYADYKILLERKNVVPLSDDGEILCDFIGTEYAHGHSCFITDEEIKQEVSKNIVVVKGQNLSKKTKLVEKELLQNLEDYEFDPLFNDAAVLALKLKEISTTDLQKHLKLGYARASRVMDQLEEKGIVGYSRGAFPRFCLINSIEELLELLDISDEELQHFQNGIRQDVTQGCSESEENEETTGEQTDNSKESLKKTSKIDKFSQFLSRSKNIVICIVVAFIAMLAIYYVLNMPRETVDKIMSYVIGYGFFPAVIILCVWLSKRKRVKGKRYSIYAIDNISDGHDFEYVIADLLKNVGFYNVKVTVGSGDYGIDVVGWYDGASYAIQCKKYSNKVGVSAVQEAYSGRSYYGCNYAVVVTNNYFTPAAQKLARSNGVILWDRTMVKRLINGRL